MHAAPRVVQDSLFSTSPLQPSLSAKFAVAHRLLRKDGFDHVICAESISGRYFKIFFVRNGKKNARLGIIAGKKILFDAACRNRAKRIIREVFRQHSIKRRKLDVVVMVKRAFSQEEGAQADNLKILFDQIENRCAES